MKDDQAQPETTAKPIYCPRRQQHGAVCETPNSCAGGADCRLGPDLSQHMKDRPATSQTTPEECSVVTWPTAAMWDAWYSSIPTDIKSKLSLHDMKRIGDCFKSAFGVPDVAIGSVQRSAFDAGYDAHRNGYERVAEYRRWSNT